MRITTDGTDLILRFRYDVELKDFVKSLDKARWNPEHKYWTCKDNSRNRKALEYRLTGKPSFSDNAIVTTNRPLFQHQKRIADFVLNRKRAYIAATMGTGKTLSSIEIMEHAEKLYGVSDWWYVAPRSALLSVRMEMRKWNSVIEPTFLTYEAFVKLVRSPGFRMPNGVIFDECHKLKSVGSIRSQAARWFAERVEWLVMMTGTPAPKDPLDWYNQIEIIYPGWLSEGNIHKFKRRLAETETVDLSLDENSKSNHCYTAIVDWKEDEIRRFREEISDIVIRVDKADCLDLPDKVYVEHIIEPESSSIQRYKMLIKNSRTTIEALNRCRQLSDGFIYFEGKTLRSKSNPKLEALEELSIGKNRLVIFAGFTESIDLVCSKMRELEWEVIRIDGRGFDGSVERFMDNAIAGKICIVAHPKSGGTGLNLTAADTIIYYSNDFDGESRMQSEDRIHRPGCVSATIIDLIHLPTDKYVLTKLKNKEKLQGITLKDMALELEKLERIR